MESSHSQGLLPPVSLGLAIHHRAWCKRSLIVQSPEQRKNCEFEVGNGCGRPFKQKAKQTNKQTNKRTNKQTNKQVTGDEKMEAVVQVTMTTNRVHYTHLKPKSITNQNSHLPPCLPHEQPRTPPLVPWKHS